MNQRKMAGTKVPAKLEQGGFTSGRRKGPQTLFLGIAPGNLPLSINRVTRQWTFQRAPTSRNFFWLVCKNRNSLDMAASIHAGPAPGLGQSGEPGFRHFAQ